MGRRFADIAFTPAVQALQTRYGSRSQYARAQARDVPDDTLRADETEFLESADSCYLATVSETGWPYIQHRGGPKGFLKVVSPSRIAFADFRGNLQYISAGNVEGNDRASMFVMDYAHRQRLKLLGHLRFVDAPEADPELLRKVVLPGYRARIERVALFDVVAFDWNCPQHITQRFTLEEVEAATQPLRDRIADLEARLLAAGATHRSEEP